MQLADEKYLENLKEVREKEENMKKFNKEQCEIEFKRYNEKFLKSLANYETYNKEKKEMEKITSENLQRLES